MLKEKPLGKGWTEPLENSLSVPKYKASNCGEP
jgi:hypothetical protein